LLEVEGQALGEAGLVRVVAQVGPELEQVAATVGAGAHAARGARAVQVVDVQVGDEQHLHVRVGLGLDAVAREYRESKAIWVGSASLRQRNPGLCDTVRDLEVAPEPSW
jgi:putative hemolysin